MNQLMTSIGFFFKVLLDLKSYSILMGEYSLNQGKKPCIDYHIEEVSGPPKRNDEGGQGQDNPDVG